MDHFIPWRFSAGGGKPFQEYPGLSPGSEYPDRQSFPEFRWMMEEEGIDYYFARAGLGNEHGTFSEVNDEVL